MTAGGAGGMLVVISGPSGVGKSTICDELLALPGFERVITCTTRAPRGQEVHGKDYWFVDTKEFEDGILGRRFLEHARVHGRFYGTPREPVETGLSQGKYMLLNIDVQGAAQIRRAIGASGEDRLAGRLTTVFLLPPDPAELLRRLASRGTDSPAEIQARLRTAERELAESGAYDLRVTNVEIGRTVREILDHLRYQYKESGLLAEARVHPAPGDRTPEDRG